MSTLERHRRRRAPALAFGLLGGLALAAAAVIVATVWTETDAREALDEAFARPIGSARVEAALTVELDRADRDARRLRAWASGPIRLVGPRRRPDLDWRVGAEGTDEASRARVISAGNRSVVVLEGRAYELDRGLVDGAVRALVGDGGDAEGGEPSGLEPRRWFQNVERRGDGRVADEPTERFVAELRVDRLLEDGRRALASATGLGALLPTAEERRALAYALRGSRAVIEVGRADGVLRRIDAAGALTIPASRRRQARGVSGGGFAFDLRLLDVDRPQPIPRPPAARPFRELLRRSAGPRLSP
jgi:hypothetical protein